MRSTVSPHRAPTAATPVAFVAAIVHACQCVNLDPAQLLKEAQIAPDLLATADARVTTAQFERLSLLAMQALDDEALGWFERRLPWGSYGMLARASLGAPTLELALKRWCRHHALLTRGLLLHVETQHNEARIVLKEQRPPGGDGALREFCHVSVLRNIHGLACWFIDSRIPLHGSSFAYAAPSHASAYAVLFDGPARFSAQQSAICFDSRYLALPLKRDEAAMTQMLQHALPLQVRPYRRDRLLVPRVRQLLLAEPQHARNAQALASQLHCSARSLHRQLKVENASLQALKDQVRQQRAMQLLQRSAQPVKQVAQAAGFQNVKSFTRAFRGWTGMSPAAWRQQFS